MKSGDKVVCVDDQGWLIPEPGYEHLAPKKGGVYVIRSYEIIGGVGAVSLVGGNDCDFYRACRFRPLEIYPEHLTATQSGQRTCEGTPVANG